MKFERGSEFETTKAMRTGARRSPQYEPAYPVVDLFAGPGGLGEGFASSLTENGATRFQSIVSIERDEFSHQTLLLRHFLRHFPDGEAPDEYYDFLAKRITIDDLFATWPEASADARRSALRISLGPESHAQVKARINDRLGGSGQWALVGGPPCQAYSLVGRSRMMSRPGFEQDERHTLYLEYLRIIADHRPPIFVMENVKGLLSATIEGKSAISRIVRDLREPGRGIRGVPNDLTYKLYSLSEEDMADAEADPRLFVVRAEEYGIPQARHRMFIVGIRGDLKVRPGILRKMDAPTVADTIGLLPGIRSGLSKGEDSFDAWQAELRKISKLNIRHQLNGANFAGDLAERLSLANVIEMRSPKAISSARYPTRLPTHPILRKLHDGRLSVLTSHEARSHMATDLRRYLYAAMFARTTGRSPKLSDFPKVLLPDHQNVELGRTGKMFSDRFRVQLAGQVSTTITSHPTVSTSCTSNELSPAGFCSVPPKNLFQNSLGTMVAIGQTSLLTHWLSSAKSRKSAAHPWTFSVSGTTRTLARKWFRHLRMSPPL